MRFLLLGCLALSGCGYDHYAIGYRDVTQPSNLHYVRDARTNLCFAVLNFQGYNTTGLSIAKVDCSPEVMRRVEIDEER